MTFPMTRQVPHEMSRRPAAGYRGARPPEHLRMSRRAMGRVMPRLKVSDPKARQGEDVVVRVGVDIPSADADFLQAYAAYRNAIAKAQGATLRRLWTRKTLIESLLAAMLDQHREQLRQMIDACGPLPDPKDDEAMKRYAAKVLAWSAEFEEKSG